MQKIQLLAVFQVFPSETSSFPWHCARMFNLTKQNKINLKKKNRKRKKKKDKPTQNNKKKRGKKVKILIATLWWNSYSITFHISNNPLPVCIQTGGSMYLRQLIKKGSGQSHASFFFFGRLQRWCLSFLLFTFYCLAFCPSCSCWLSLSFMASNLPPHGP